MADTPLLAPIVALLLLGCASGPSKIASNQASDASEAPSVVELVTEGREASERGDAVRAEQYLSLAIERGANRREIMPLLLRACVRSSHIRTALNYAAPYLLEHPEDAALRYLVANLHISLGQSEAARHELALLLQADAANPDAHYLLGIIDSETDIESARAHFLATLEHSEQQGQRTEVRSRLAALALQERTRERDSLQVESAIGGQL